MKKNKFIIGIILALIIVLSILILIPDKQDEVIKVGAIFPLTGKDADWGIRSQKGIELALEKVNKDKKNIKVIYEDSEGNSKKAVTAAHKLINVDKVQVLFCQLSDICSAIAPIAQENKVILFGFTSTPGFTDEGDFIFNLRGDAIMAGKSVGEFASEKYEKVAVFYLNNPTHEGVYTGFKQVFENNNKEIVFVENHNKEDSDFRTLLIKAKQSNPDALAFFSRVGNIVDLVKQARELNLNQPIIGSLGMDTQDFLDSLGKLSENIVYPTSIVSKDVDNEKLKKALERYKEKYKEDMPVWTAESYDGINLLAFVKQNGAFTPEEIKEALMEIKDFQGLSNNKIVFDKDRLLIKDYYIFTVKDGQFVKYE